MDRKRYLFAAAFCLAVLTPAHPAVYHRVRKGETLASISRKHGVPVDRIRAMNNIKSSRITAGQKLLVKKDAGARSTVSAVREGAGPLGSGEYSAVCYTVRKGDTLSKVARKYGISVAKLRKMNALRGSSLKAGQTLKVQLARTSTPKAAPAKASGGVRETRETRESTVSPNPIIQASEKVYYRVERGDSLTSIAEKFAISRETLKKTNLLMDELVRPGQVLVIPARTETPEAETADAGIEAAATQLGLNKAIVEEACRYLDTPYRLGGKGESGIDCSTLARLCYGKFGIKLPTTSLFQFLNGTAISMRDALPGDLVFFSRGSRVGHVGIYLGEDRFIHASPAEKKVTISSLNSSYFRSHFAGIKRYIAAEIPANDRGQEHAE